MKTPREKPGQRCRALRNGFPGRTGKNHDNSRGNMPHMCGEDWMTSPSAGAVAETPPRRGEDGLPVLEKRDCQPPHMRGEDTGR